MPVTKGDKRFHGYGVKSIKFVCDRYDGDITIKAENNVFTMNILFMNGVKPSPIATDEKPEN